MQHPSACTGCMHGGTERRLARRPLHCLLHHSQRDPAVLGAHSFIMLLSSVIIHSIIISSYIRGVAGVFLPPSFAAVKCCRKVTASDVGPSLLPPHARVLLTWSCCCHGAICFHIATCCSRCSGGLMLGGGAAPWYLQRLFRLSRLRSPLVAKKASSMWGVLLHAQHTTHSSQCTCKPGARPLPHTTHTRMHIHVQS